MQRTPVLQRSFPVKTLTFREHWPMRLRNVVSSKHDRISGRGCIGEMTTLLTCLKEHEFENTVCGKEVEAFKQCAAKEKVEIREMEELMKTGALSENALKMTSVQINELMRRCPQPGAGGIKYIKKRPPHVPYSTVEYPTDPIVLPQKKRGTDKKRQNVTINL